MPITYTADSTLLAFHRSSADIRLVVGPVGTGKSTGMIAELLARCLVMPVCTDGVRRSRVGVLRATYPSLKTTTLKTFAAWFGELFSITYDQPITAKARQKLPDGTVMETEFVFISCASEDEVNKLKSLDLTMAFINEVSETPKGVFDMLRSRVARYPSLNQLKEPGKGYWSGVIMDTNPFGQDHWLYDLFILNRPEGFEVYQQPPPLLTAPEAAELPYTDPARYIPNPEATYARYQAKGYNYWLDQVRGSNVDHIRANLLGEYIRIKAGEPVFNGYFDVERHVSRGTLAPSPTGRVLLGVDFGLNFAAVIGQLLPTGGIVILDELTLPNCSLEEALSDALVPLLRSKYAGNAIQVYGDPAGAGRSPIDKRHAFELFAQHGIAAQPAPTNVFAQRRDAVISFLQRNNGLVIASHCTALVKALDYGYVYKSTAVNGQAIISPNADKNEHSHIADALQYLCVSLRMGAGTNAQVRVVPAPVVGW